SLQSPHHFTNSQISTKLHSYTESEHSTKSHHFTESQISTKLYCYTQSEHSLYEASPFHGLSDLDETSLLHGV
ncbi:hypothetical protein J6590_106950, partial [Homalodisca vitripennis]